MEVLYSTGTLSNFFQDSKADIQLGYELVNNLGFSLVQEANNTFVPITKRIINYDFFVASEIKATERFSIRPGIRYSFQSMFENQYASSLGLRYLFEKGLELRGSTGRSFRTPTFQELYSKLIFDGHFFTGNENLIPETSISYEMSLKKETIHSSGFQLSNMLTGSYLDVNDRIDMALVGFNPDTGNPEYQYINISKYKMWNVSSVNQFRENNLTVNLGASIIGVSQKIENQVFTSDDKFLYSFNLNSSVSYSVPSWKTIFSAYYKHNGKSQQFVEGTSEFLISEIDASNWLDATVLKRFFNYKLEVTIGARNLFDIKNINQTRTAEGAGHATSGEVLMAYGRSYFVKLTYNLNI
jgi:outer membrane receptor for ferrienterochelin and colicins